MNSMLGYIVDCNAVEMCIEFQRIAVFMDLPSRVCFPWFFKTVAQNRCLKCVAFILMEKVTSL